MSQTQSQTIDITRARNTYRNLTAAELVEHIIRRGEAKLAVNGPIAVQTGERTGRSPKDKFIVKEPTSQDKVWWGKVNKSIGQDKFDALHNEVESYLRDKDVYVQDLYAGAAPGHRIPIRIVTEYAWQSLFAQHMFLPRNNDDAPQFTVVAVPNFNANPQVHGTNSKVFVLVDFGKKLVLIGGTHYAGEIKKSIFTVMNYVLPQQGVMSMHCSANIGEGGDTAIFFGLSGTGKTTLSADPERLLIGDDEHGWGDDGVFNIEGGCYAKVIRLSREAEPDIYATTERFGTIIENVVIDDKSRKLDLDDDSITENTRAAYPIDYIRNVELSGRGGQPQTIIMLTADAFGVLPPISKLTSEQAMYHFISGYTAKVAGTEAGMGKDPEATFSTCFGAPFMVLHPSVYANLLRQRMEKHKVSCWLVNTGWSGGPYGVGKRMRIAHTRAMIKAALNGSLLQSPMFRDPIFNLDIPTTCDGVPAEVLNPRNTWADKNAYDVKARDLAEKFKKNFEEYSEGVEESVLAAGPR